MRRFTGRALGGLAGVAAQAWTGAALAQLPSGAGPGVGAAPPAGGAPTAPPLPHDIRGLLPYIPGPLAYIVWALGGLAFLAAGVCAWRWWKHKKAVVPPVDPWDALKARVAALRVEDGFGRKAQEEYFYQLSLLLREGIEMRTAIRATDLTLRELAVQLRHGLPLPRPEGEEILALLERADLVKFAEAPATAAEATAAQARVAAWVERLRPLEVAGAKAAAGAGTGGTSATGSTSGAGAATGIGAASGAGAASGSKSGTDTARSTSGAGAASGTGLTSGMGTDLASGNPSPGAAKPGAGPEAAKPDAEPEAAKPDAEPDGGEAHALR